MDIGTPGHQGNRAMALCGMLPGHSEQNLGAMWTLLPAEWDYNQLSLEGGG